MTYEILSLSGCPYSWCALLGMEFKGLTFNNKEVEIDELKGFDFNELDPRSKVPVLIDGDTNIYESIAILAYLEVKHPEIPLFGSSAHQTGIIWQRIFEIENKFRDPLEKKITRPLFQGKAQKQASTIQTAVIQTHEILSWVDNILLNDIYLAGKTLSAADFMYMPVVQSLLWATSREDAQALYLCIHPLEKTYPNISNWLQRIEDVPGYYEIYPSHWRN